MLAQSFFNSSMQHEEKEMLRLFVSTELLSQLKFIVKIFFNDGTFSFHVLARFIDVNLNLSLLGQEKHKSHLFFLPFIFLACTYL